MNTIERKKLFLALTGAALVALSSACSHVQITRTAVDASTPDDVKHGFTVYAPKPYLLVARAGEGGKVISVTTVMLPDTMNPHYLRQRGVIGKLNYNYAIENGMLKSFGSDADSKTSEILGQVVAGVTAYGGLAKNLAESKKLEAEADKIVKQSVSNEEVANARAGVLSARKSVGAIVDSPPVGVTELQSMTLAGVAGTLRVLAARLDAPDAVVLPSVQQVIAKQLSAVAKELDEIKGVGSKDFVEAIVGPISEIKTAAGLLAGTPPDKASFELYQITITASGTQLVRVEMPQ